jgi:hypothetical protein
MEAAPEPLASAQTTTSALFFLPKKLWSPRYEPSFYSVTIEACRTVDGADADRESGLAALLAAPAPLRGNAGLPAVYYQVTVHRERGKKVVWRRYSHFSWLYREWAAHPLPPRQEPGVARSDSDGGGRAPRRAAREEPPLPPPPPLPSGPCSLLWWALPKRTRDSLAEKRRSDLEAWLQDALTLASPAGHTYASHPATVAFLELRQDR